MSETMINLLRLVGVASVIFFALIGIYLLINAIRERILRNKEQKGKEDRR